MRSAFAELALATVLAGCGGGPAAWTVVYDQTKLDRVVLSAWGTSAKDVYAVGGGLGNAAGSLALHYDGHRWTELATGSNDSFWWTWGAGSDDVFFVGEKGAVYHWNGSAAERLSTPTTATLYGVWGASASDVWAVGGSPLGNGPNDVILHYDGGVWTQVPLAQPTGTTLFKIWGHSANDIFVVGQGGTILHYDGTAWSPQASGTVTTLFTVSGRGADDVYAVGGPPAALLHYDGHAWSPLPLVAPASSLNGVSVLPSGEGWVVGVGGTKWHLTDGAWKDQTDAAPTQDLHAVWQAPDGESYALGGNFLAPMGPATTRFGVIAYFGSSPPAPAP